LSPPKAELTRLFDEIRILLDAPSAGAQAPPLAHVEDTLTTGYARALALEAERWRLERKLAETAAKLSGPRREISVDELSGIADRLSTTDDELSRLRGLLASLRDRAGQLRVAKRA
jgi:hypothetical protein